MYIVYRTCVIVFFFFEMINNKFEIRPISMFLDTRNLSNKSN